MKNDHPWVKIVRQRRETGCRRNINKIKLKNKNPPGQCIKSLLREKRRPKRAATTIDRRGETVNENSLAHFFVLVCIKILAKGEQQDG